MDSTEPTDRDWAYAIAVRIADELLDGTQFPDDVGLLEEVLVAAFLAVPHEMRRLIGTSIIEEDWFE